MAGAAAGGLVARALEAMLKECSGRKYPALQKAAQSCLDDMKEVKQGPLSDQSNNAAPSQGEKRVDSNGSANGGNESDPTTISEADAAPHSKETHKSITAALVTAGCILDEKQAELVLQPLRLAFETKNIKLVDLALDCLHKFIAYVHLEGDPGLENGKNASLFTEILNMVCSCVDNSSSDSTILQVLKVFLTAVSSTRFRVHGEPMLGVIRVCYNIALNSKSSINQVTSKAMLTQMISIVFRRMESDEVSTSVSSSEHSDPHVVSSSNTDNGEITIDDQDGKKLTLGDALAMSRENESSPASVEELQSLAGGADIKGLEAVLDKAVQLEDGKKISRGIDIESMNVGQHDALLLFRTLCKMGMKEEGDEVTTKTRLLSLELLQSLLEGVSQSFSKNFHFIDSVKAYLFMHYCEPLFLHLLLYFRCPSRSKVAIKSNIKMDASIIVKEGNTGSEICASSNLTKVVEANDNNEESSGTELSSDDTSSSSSSSEDEDDDDDGSDDNEEENDRIHKQNNVDEEVEEGEIRDAELEEMLVDSDGEDEVPKGPVKSKNEVVVLPPVAKVEVSLEPHHQLLPVGVISSILGNTVIVEGLEKHSPLNEGSILWITETRLPLGFIDEIFGPVKNPFYLIRYNSDMELPVGISTGTAVSVVMEFATHIINEKELCGKAYDASGDNDEDMSDEVEFSDDEKEAEYRKSLHREKRGCGTREQDSNDSFVGKKTHRKGAGSRKHSSTMRQAPNLIDKQLPYVTDFVQLPLAAVDFGGSRYSCSQLEISGVNPPASSLAVHQTTQTGSFGDLPQQLPQQPNAFWANGFQAQQQQNLAIQGLMTNIMMGMQLGDPTFSQQHANQLGNFPSGMPLQQQLTPNFQYTAPTPWLGGLMNPAFTVMPMGSIFGGNVGQMTFDGSNVQEQVAPAFPQGQNFVQPPRATVPTGRRPPMQFDRGRSSFHGKTPHHRGGRHSKRFSNVKFMGMYLEENETLTITIL